MNLFPLPVFPEGSLDSSVVTTVWVSVMIGAMLNLRFGWLLTGLIVPGYLLPILLEKPLVVAVIVAEGAVAYGLVWLFAEKLTRYRLWSDLFGMDRFFAVILSATLVRVVVDGAVLPWLGEWLVHTYHINFDYPNNLHSFGLTTVSLMAYTFTRSGLRRGLFTLSVQMALTWVVVVLIFSRFTNFNLTGISFMYEEMASHILSSPKACIIMILTAILASRMNLFYGWDFNGILVPAFVAMLWNQPAKIVTTMTETFAVLFLARAALRLPFFKNLTMEKARQVMLFFSVSFFYKFVLGHLIPLVLPGVRVTDVFGFGYILCSLIAMRIHMKGIAVKLTNCTLQTSFAAVIIATGVGFSLSRLGLSMPWLFIATATPVLGAQPAGPPPATLLEQLETLRVSMYGSRFTPEPRVPLPGDLARFDRAVSLLLNPSATSENVTHQAKTSLEEMGYTLSLLENRYWVIHEHGQARGWGFFVIDTHAKGRLLVEVPAPMDEPSTFLGGTRIFRLIEARALAVHGSSCAASENNPLTSSRTLLARFHMMAGMSGTLQVRSRDGQRVPTLRIKRSLPADLHLAPVEARTGPLTTLWTLEHDANQLAELSHADFAQLNLPPTFALGSDGPKRDQDAKVVTNLNGSLTQHMQALKAQVAPEGSGNYRPPQMAELLYLDEEVLTPVLEARATLDPTSSDGQATLSALASAAAVVGYQINILEDPRHSTRYLMLEEEPKGRQRWGTYVFRLGPASPLTVQIPKPGADAGSLEFGLWLFEQTRGQALLMAGALPLTTRDRSSDVNRIGPQGNLFALVSQVILRETPEAALIIQVRSLSAQASLPSVRNPGVDILLAHKVVGDVSIPMAALQGTLDNSGFRTRTTRELQESPELGAEWLPASRYLAATSNKGVVLAWLAPDLKRDLRALEEDTALLHQLAAQRVPTRRVDVARMLLQGRSMALPQAFLDALETYIARRDVALLAQLQSRWPDIRLRCWIDEPSGRAFLVAGKGEQPEALASFGSSTGPWRTLPPASTEETVRALLADRTVRLVGAMP